ncbi:DNA-binding LytR/AlgR family response regulator [Aequitasia blattaphilus]|uniref:Stage 0 sporulation protein A homolog n=1 Tax=Aequitasia blattaphilus TaxID=2949332 RepID=A0ABT1EBY8_9FIRM|nr:LytTR family DNA-binding domain-containing protein [Aequitasia blattaphilus]MCP1103349.1 LytTR family DNA-binding domain-containing protein [Aequitasia blattaphilus]MCR8615989.1 LytTR family DNA-binding domain-containing protein [Aequitasia blattaphilus]
MIKIAICDDSEKVVEGLKRLIERYTEETGVQMIPYTFLRGQELVSSYIGDYDIIFLDIKMPGLNGIETAKKIREIDKDVIIIFLTSMLQYAFESYKVNAGNYIQKPISYMRLKDELERWVQKLLVKEEPYIFFHNNDGKHRIFLKNISYIDTFNRNLLVHTDIGNLVCFWSLKEMESKIGQMGFQRSHSAYLVNLFYVENVESTEVKLCTNERIPLSKTKKKGFLEALARYWGTRG